MELQFYTCTGKMEENSKPIFPTPKLSNMLLPFDRISDPPDTDDRPWSYSLFRKGSAPEKTKVDRTKYAHVCADGDRFLKWYASEMVQQTLALTQCLWSMVIVYRSWHRHASMSKFKRSDFVQDEIAYYIYIFSSRLFLWWGVWSFSLVLGTACEVKSVQTTKSLWAPDTMTTGNHYMRPAWA